MARFTMSCPACGRTSTFEGKLSFREECACGQELHACITCRFYDRYAENECKEPIAEPVRVKDRRNLCEEYRPKTLDGAGEDDATDLAKQKLAALFGGPKPAASSSTDDAKAKLEALFKKKN